MLPRLPCGFIGVATFASERRISGQSAIDTNATRLALVTQFIIFVITFKTALSISVLFIIDFRVMQVQSHHVAMAMVHPWGVRGDHLLPLIVVDLVLNSDGKAMSLNMLAMQVMLPIQSRCRTSLVPLPFINCMQITIIRTLIRMSLMRRYPCRRSDHQDRGVEVEL